MKEMEVQRLKLLSHMWQLCYCLLLMDLPVFCLDFFTTLLGFSTLLGVNWEKEGKLLDIRLFKGRGTEEHVCQVVPSGKISSKPIKVILWQHHPNASIRGLLFIQMLKNCFWFFLFYPLLCSLFCLLLFNTSDLERVENLNLQISL